MRKPKILYVTYGHFQDNLHNWLRDKNTLTARVNV